jgi:hypothetical protein
VPAVPAFELDLPTGWDLAAAPGLLATLSAGDHSDWSVVVSSVRVEAGDDLRSVAVRSFARQRAQYPAAAITAQRTGRFGDRLTYLREVAVPMADDRRVAQIQAMFLAPDAAPSVRDAFSLVATCPDGELDRLGPLFVDLVASFRFVS